MIRCPICTAENEDTERFCRNCGQKLPTAGRPTPAAAPPPAAEEIPAPPTSSPSADELACGICGTLNSASFRYCKSCGQLLQAEQAPEPIPQYPGPSETPTESFQQQSDAERQPPPAAAESAAEGIRGPDVSTAAPAPHDAPEDPGEATTGEPAPAAHPSADLRDPGTDLSATEIGSQTGEEASTAQFSPVHSEEAGSTGTYEAVSSVASDASVETPAPSIAPSPAPGPPPSAPTTEAPQTSSGVEMTSLACPMCGHPAAPGERFCGDCGTRLQSAHSAAVSASVCPACLAEVESEDKFCKNCGGKLSPGSSARPGPRLVMISGDDETVHPLDGRQLSIGRAAANDIGIRTDGYVSSFHARVIVEGDGVYVEDAGSTNGTFLRVRQRTQLKQGDEIKVGQTILRYESGEGV